MAKIMQRPGFDSDPWHDCEAVNSAFVKLMDELIAFERTTGRQSALVFRCESGAIVRLMNGKPMTDIGVSDEQLLGMIQ
jgi:hypothetical protein